MAARLAATACVLVLASPSVWPSASARATSAVPRLPPPPTRFSTTSCWPRRSPTFCATRRATMSELLPAVNGTMKRIGRSGQRASADCASAAPAEMIPASEAKTRRTAKRFMDRTPRGDCLRGNTSNLRASSCDLLGFAQALDQGAAQQKGARTRGILRRAAQLVVVLLAHGRVLLSQEALVADGLRLRVLQGDVTALALVAVEQVLLSFPAQDLDQLLRQVEGVVNAAVHAHGADRAVHVRGVAGEDRTATAEFRRHALVHDVEVAADDVEVLARRQEPL